MAEDLSKLKFLNADEVGRLLKTKPYLMKHIELPQELSIDEKKKIESLSDILNAFIKATFCQPIFGFRQKEMKEKCKQSDVAGELAPALHKENEIVVKEEENFADEEVKIEYSKQNVFEEEQCFSETEIIEQENNLMIINSGEDLSEMYEDYVDVGMQEDYEYAEDEPQSTAEETEETKAETEAQEEEMEEAGDVDPEVIARIKEIERVAKKEIEKNATTETSAAVETLKPEEEQNTSKTEEAETEEIKAQTQENENKTKQFKDIQEMQKEREQKEKELMEKILKEAEKGEKISEDKIAQAFKIEENKKTSKKPTSKKKKKANKSAKEAKEAQQPQQSDEKEDIKKRVSLIENMVGDVDEEFIFDDD